MHGHMHVKIKTVLTPKKKNYIFFGMLCNISVIISWVIPLCRIQKISEWVFQLKELFYDEVDNLTLKSLN